MVLISAFFFCNEYLRVFLFFFLSVGFPSLFWLFHCPPLFLFLIISTVLLVLGTHATPGAISWATLSSITFPSALLSVPCVLTLLTIFHLFSKPEIEQLVSLLFVSYGLLHAVSTGVCQYPEFQRKTGCPRHASLPLHAFRDTYHQVPKGSS